MTFFVDANVVIYSAVPGERREPCLRVLDAIARGDAAGRTSTAALEEVWHIELSEQVRSIGDLTARGYAILRPLLPVTDAAFGLALSIEAPQLGTNDRLHAATCRVHGIEAIVSADAGFDDVDGLQRIDPLDERAVRKLCR